MLRLVIYVSEYRGDPRDIDTDLAAIRAVSRRHNHMNEVTGILLYQNHHFVQAVEGPLDSIEDLVQRLRRDIRHSNIEILVDIPISQRMFGDWDMNTLNLDKAELFNSTILVKLRDAYSKNVEISDANFVCLLQDLLNTPEVETYLNG